jgi:Protein of unknown function VcgC/VcgE (DUF2780)
MRRMLLAGSLVLVCAVMLSAQATAPDLSNTANPELVGLFTKELGVTPAQAEGGVGALLGLAKTRLKPAEFSQVSSAIPGTDALLKAAPAMGGGGAMGALAGAGGLASLAGSFSKLGLNADTAAKFAPTLLKYVNGKGAAGAASALAKAFK